MSTTYEVEITKTAITIPNPAGDLYPDEDPAVFLFSCFQGLEFIIDLTIKLYEVTETVEEGGPVTTRTQLDVDDVLCELDSEYSSATFEVTDTDPLNYTVRLTGDITNALKGESYTFVLPTNDPTQGFPISTTSISNVPSNYLAIIDWTLPTVFASIFSRSYELLTDAYSFTVNPADENQVFTMSQYVFFDAGTSLIIFRNLVLNGVI